MSFDKFPLAVESRDPSQAEKSFFSVFLMRDKSERIECIHFAESPDLSF